MDAKLKDKMGSLGIQAFKIMLGSSCAMMVAMYLNLEFATSAAIIALLTILTTKLETLRLSVYRIITYCISVVLCSVIFQNISSIWIAYGLFIFIVVFYSELMGWKATISVNAVIGTHFLSTLDFSLDMVINELMLVLIGISIAIILNFYNMNSYSEKRLIHNMQYTENEFQGILEQVREKLAGKKADGKTKVRIDELEKNIEHFIELACEHNNNTFKKDGDYYERYFEMRLMQLSILHNFNYELTRMKHMPQEAVIVADYVNELKEHVLELNHPRKQIHELKVVFARLLEFEVPKSKEEFEARAKLYHLLMDLEEFLVLKKRFVDSVSESNRYKKDYHNKDEYNQLENRVEEQEKLPEKTEIHKKKVIKK